MNGAAVRVYSLERDGDLFLTRNFQVKEFACHDGSDPIFIHIPLVEFLQKMRDWCGGPVYVEKHSAYRTPSWNKKQKGSERSYHMYGLAVDVSARGKTPAQLATWAEAHMPGGGGIGLYKTFVHIDFRTGRYRFDKTTGMEIAVDGF